MKFVSSLDTLCGLIAQKEEAQRLSVSQPHHQPLNAFEIMMEAQRNLSRSNQLPAQVTARNNKDQLFNDIVAFFEKKGWKWNDGGNSHGKSFIAMLQEVMWYIDGHHETLEARSCSIPSEFKSFTGYNVPEKSKHRKRAHVNLSQEVLSKHVMLLKESQMCSWM